MTYRDLPRIMYTDIHPTPVENPKLVLFNDELAETLSLDRSVWKNGGLLSGNILPPDFRPVAQAYVGHQFGYLAMLGDGKTILLAEVLTRDGVRFDIQLKGSGRTPYSRGGDGRAALGPMLREYMVSEAMHALGIPTSRSLAVVTTGERVYREKACPGAILTRVAKSHLRVGTLQYAFHQGVIREVADYAIGRHDPGCWSKPHPYACFFQNVLNRQAELIALWQAIGFIHGVMNTDNMAISGETIDYGPCAFMDIYKAEQVFSSIDRAGRYSYASQPTIAKWNLARLAETLIPLLHENQETAVEMATEILGLFDLRYESAWLKQFGEKLGITAAAEDRELIAEFLRLLETEKKDFTNSFLHVTYRADEPLFATEAGLIWQDRWRRRVREEGSQEKARERMLKVNPRVLPRNLKLNEVLEQAEAGDLEPVKRMLAIVRQPFAFDVPDDYMQPGPVDEPFVTFCGT